jgi:hypothetical protein
VKIVLIFSPKKIGKKFAFLTQNKAILCKNLIRTLVFEKNANFLPKIVIITSTPGHPDWRPELNYNIYILSNCLDISFSKSQTYDPELQRQRGKNLQRN